MFHILVKKRHHVLSCIQYVPSLITLTFMESSEIYFLVHKELSSIPLILEGLQDLHCIFFF